MFGDSKHPGMAYHNRPEEDPYITVHEDSDSDRDEFVLKSADRLILAARNEDDVSHLEVGLVPVGSTSNQTARCNYSCAAVISLSSRESTVLWQILWKGQENPARGIYIGLKCRNLIVGSQDAPLLWDTIYKTPGAVCRRHLLQCVGFAITAAAGLQSSSLMETFKMMVCGQDLHT